MYTVHLALSLVMLSRLASSAGAKEPTWEKVFEVDGRDSWLTSVWAKDDTEWFAGGKGFIVRGHRTSVSRATFPGRVIMGFGDDGAGQLFALGAEQLVVRFDGAQWIQEHEAHLHTGSDRAREYDDILQFTYLEGDSLGPLYAFGPISLLVRETDGKWTAPLDPDRTRLRDRALLGPRATLPAGCEAPGWLSLGRNVGWFSCRDGRAFLFEANNLTPLGRMPSGCSFHVSGSTLHRGDVYMSCGERGLWRSNGHGWQRVVAPKAVRSIAVTARCVLVATMRALWRNCGPDSTGQAAP